MLPTSLNRLLNEAGTAAIDIRAGRRVVDHADDVIRVHPGWLAEHGLGDIVQDDGGLVLDSDDRYRYALVRGDLPGGFGIYQRVAA